MDISVKQTKRLPEALEGRAGGSKPFVLMARTGHFDGSALFELRPTGKLNVLVLGWSTLFPARILVPRDVWE